MHIIVCKKIKGKKYFTLRKEIHKEIHKEIEGVDKMKRVHMEKGRASPQKKVPTAYL